MKDVWLLAGKKGYESHRPIMWCHACDDSRESYHTYCFECGSKLEKALEGPAIDITSDYAHEVGDGLLRKGTIFRVK